MPELDALKERISFLKLNLVLMAAVDLGLVLWLLSYASTASAPAVASGVIAAVVVTIGTALIDRRLRRHIRRIGSL